MKHDNMLSVRVGGGALGIMIAWWDKVAGFGVVLLLKYLPAAEWTPNPATLSTHPTPATPPQPGDWFTASMWVSHETRGWGWGWGWGVACLGGGGGRGIGRSLSILTGW